MFKKIGALATINSLLLLTACLNGGDVSVEKASQSKPGQEKIGEYITAQFIDSPVKGLRFETESGVKSATGNMGLFRCKRGENVSFSLAGFDIGTGACADKIFIIDLYSSIDDFYYWGRAAAVLQTFALNNSNFLDLSVINQAEVDLRNVGHDYYLSDSSFSPALQLKKPLLSVSPSFSPTAV